MAPSRLPACKVCSKKDAGKYRCPVDHVDYCSVVCFKQHKASGCSTESTYEPQPLLLLPVVADEQDEDDRPRKKLKELHWPAEPDSALWQDPLKRDDVKPLRGFEMEAVATSPAMRMLLASPALRTTLTRLSSLPPSAREPSLRLLLGLPPMPADSIYRPNPSQRFSSSAQTPTASAGARGGARGRGGSRGRGRGGRGGGSFGGRDEEPKLLESTPEERKGMVRFAEEVQTILQEVREKRGV